MKEQLKEITKGFGTIIYYFALMFIGQIIFSNYQKMGISKSAAEIGIYLVMLFGIVLVYFKRLKKDFKNFKLEYIKTALKYLVIGIGVTAIMNILLNPFLQGVSSNEALNRANFESYPFSSFLTMVFIGPLIEEITFRASFQKGFKKWYTFAIFTGLLFGSAHIIASLQAKEYLEILFVIPYSSLGFFLAKAMYETDNVYTSYIAHLLNNFMCLVLLLFR